MELWYVYKSMGPHLSKQFHLSEHFFVIQLVHRCLDNGGPAVI